MPLMKATVEIMPPFKTQELIWANPREKYSALNLQIYRLSSNLVFPCKKQLERICGQERTFMLKNRRN